MERGDRARSIRVAAAVVAIGAIVVAVAFLGRPAATVDPNAAWVVSGAPTVNPSAVASASASAGASSSVAPSASAGPSSSPASTVKGLIRVDQLGYATGEHKVAFLMAATDVEGAPFTVTNDAGVAVLSGTVAASTGSWNDGFGAVHPIDVSLIVTPGTYRIAVGGPVGATSPTFRVGSAAELFGPRVDDAVAFFQAQRDGPDVIAGDLDRQPSHLHDGSIGVFDWPRYEDPDSDAIVGDGLRKIDGGIDLAGGWFDAGDFIKFTHTTAYADGLLFVAAREMGADAPTALVDEARFGQAWLERAWDADRQILYIQVGIGSGNTDGTFNGDHDLWRLPERDDTLTDAADRYRAIGPPSGAGAPGSALPPNLAGRMAAALALAAQVDATPDPARARTELELASSIFDKAKTTNVTQADVVTALPHAFYPESSWRDDLEWGAAELALAGQALKDPRADGWLTAATTWAKAYLDEEAGDDTLNLYDTSALAHADLARALRAAGNAPVARSDRGVAEADLIGDLRRQLDTGVARAAADPFRAGAIYSDFDAAPHTFGLVATAAMYGSLTGDHTYAPFATGQRDWALGANPWGVSLMIGVGEAFPHCPQHVAANLSGTVDGTPPILRGAVVNGPNDAELFADGLDEFFEEGQACPADGVDAYAAFTGRGSRFVDDVSAWQTVEPAIDFTAAALFAFALERSAP